MKVAGFPVEVVTSSDVDQVKLRLGVPGELHIYRSMPHTFLSFPHLHALPEVEAALQRSCGWLRAACAGRAQLDSYMGRVG